MSASDQYRAKLRSSNEAIDLVRNGDVIVVSTGAAEPPSLLEALSDRRRELHGVTVAQMLPMRKYGYFDPQTVAHVRHVGPFLGAASRQGAQQGWIDTLACNFSELPRYFRDGLTSVNVVFCLASPMDEHGYFSLGLGADYTMAAIEKARAVVLEVNPNVPYSYGQCQVHISKVLAVVESELPIIEAPLPAIGPVQEAIGRHVASLIEDGSTLQIGYGGIPDAVAVQLRDKRDLGIHTELMGDALLSLVECGAVTNARKNFLPGKSIATIAVGSARLYRFMNRNPAFEMHPSDFTNDPWLAGRNDNFVAVNATLQIDLSGQCGSESLGLIPYSGSGGQADFVRAANRSKGGKSIIVLPSTAKNDTVSRVSPVLDPGSLVTTSKNDVNYVVTEYGIAQLRGKSMKERARELIAIAHPAFRADLERHANRQLM